jgi:predicted DCC family thiol-disulfide oxidoreductase YuxK
MDRVIVLYDDRCGFCRWLTSKIVAWDRTRRIRFAPIRSAEGEARLNGMDPVRRDGSWHLITRDGHVVSAGAAVPLLLRELPGGSPLARVADALPRVTDGAYRAVAHRRSALGRLLHVDACDVPTKR